MSEHLKGFTETQWPIAGFVIFFALFLVFVALTFLPSESAKYKKLETLPLDENGRGAGA